MRTVCVVLRYLLPLFCLLSFLSLAQKVENTVVEGVVANAKSRQPIPFASIRIKNKPIGVTANEEGKFKFIFPATYRNETIEISSVGYTSYSQFISSLQPATYHTILLNESPVKLREVTVIAIPALEILRRAIRQLDKHFDNKSYGLEGFFRIAVKKDSDYVGLLDAAITLRDKGFSRKNSMSADLVQMRKIVDKANWFRGNWRFRSPAISFEQEFGRIERGILKYSKAKKYWKVQLEDQVFQDDDLFYILTATAKRYATYYPYYHARLYIRARDYALTQIDYDYGENIVSFSKAFPAANAFKGADNDQLFQKHHIKGTITFNDYHGKLYLNREFYQERGTIYRKSDSSRIAYEGSFEIVVNQILPGALPLPTNLINKYADIFTLADRYDSTFWANYNKPINTHLYLLAKTNLEQRGNLEGQFRRYSTGENASQPVDDLLTQQKETAHFQFFFSPGDEEAINEMGQKLEENYERITRELQSTDQPRVKVNVYPNLKAYHAAIGNPNADNWMVGSSWGADEFRLVSPSNPGPEHTYQSILQGAVHEFTHCVHAAIAQHYQSPTWLWESIACFEANQFVNPATLAYIRKGEYPSLAQMNEDTQQGYVYQLGYVVIEYVKQTWGMPQVVELLRTGGDLEAILGIGEKQFEQGFYEFVKTNYLNVQR